MLEHVEVEPLTKGPTHWKERLPEPLRTLPDSLWPTAYEIQGDVLTVKLEAPRARPSRRGRHAGPAPQRAHRMRG